MSVRVISVYEMSQMYRDRLEYTTLVRYDVSQENGWMD